MPKDKVKIKTKTGRNGKKLTKIKAKMRSDIYVGDEVKRLQRQLEQERNRVDSLERQIDSLKCEIRIIIESK